jgi:hypothetical protein
MSISPFVARIAGIISREPINRAASKKIDVNKVSKGVEHGTKKAGEAFDRGTTKTITAVKDSGKKIGAAVKCTADRGTNAVVGVAK